MPLNCLLSTHQCFQPFVAVNAPEVSEKAYCHDAVACICHRTATTAPGRLTWGGSGGDTDGDTDRESAVRRDQDLFCSRRIGRLGHFWHSVKWYVSGHGTFEEDTCGTCTGGIKVGAPRVDGSHRHHQNVSTKTAAESPGNRTRHLGHPVFCLPSSQLLAWLLTGKEPLPGSLYAPTPVRWLPRNPRSKHLRPQTPSLTSVVIASGDHGGRAWQVQGLQHVPKA
jgi:hypothetical protein